MDSISTRNLESILEVDKLKKLLQSLSVLDAIMSPEWSERYYSFNCSWGDSEQMGSMRNGCGDDFYALFNSSGCFIKGFAHESPMSPWKSSEKKPWNGMLDGIPQEFSEASNEPAFSMDAITFCIWRLYSENSWANGNITFPDHEDPDGSEYLLNLLDGDPEGYQGFAEEYYEVELPIEAIRHIYNHRRLTEDVISTLNPDVKLAEIATDLDEIGYPR